MLAICLRYCADREVAHDLMHDGFIKVFNSFDKFQDRGEGSLKAWMAKIMVNECLQYFRKKDLLRECVDVESPKGGLSFDYVDDGEFGERTERIPQKVLMEMITSLPIGYRTVFNLYVMEDKSHKEIGALLGIGEKSSSSQLSRAKAILAHKIKEYEGSNK